MAKLYVASSWRNVYQPAIVQMGLQRGIDVYDFRNPIAGNYGFSWKQITGKPVSDWTFEEYREILQHPIAQHGFDLDMEGLQADATLLVMPSGRSAHYELGYAVGRGQRTAVVYPSGVPMTDIGEHSVNAGACLECSSGVRYRPCDLRSKLYRDFEPELMVKGASDGILIGILELGQWLDSVAGNGKRKEG